MREAQKVSNEFIVIAQRASSRKGSEGDEGAPE
jgi:hypothetical protein